MGSSVCNFKASMILYIFVRWSKFLWKFFKVLAAGFSFLLSLDHYNQQLIVIYFWILL